MRATAPLVSLLLICAGPSGAAAAEQTLSRDVVSPKTALSIGVASLERAAPAGRSMPDVASLLRARLGQIDGVSVSTPDLLGGSSPSHPTTQQLHRLAEEQGLVAVVTGRTTQMGSRISIDLRLFATESGALLGTYVEETPDNQGLEEVVGRMATRLVERARTSLQHEAAPASPASAADRDAAPVAQQDAKPGLRGDAPIQIRSDELEVIQEERGRRILFQGKVRAAQEGITLVSDRLEAFYPAGAAQPERLDAAGQVIVEEGTRKRRMRCDEATYFRPEQRILCEGHAEMEQAGDRVRGKTIEIELESGRVRVRGGAEVHVEGGVPKGEGA